MKPETIFAAGRWCLAGIFILSASQKILDPGKALGMMEAKGMQLPKLFLAGAIALLLIGSISLLTGKYLRYGVSALVIFLIPTTLLFHIDFPQERVSFFKNVAILGGLLLVDAFARLQLMRGATPRTLPREG